LGESKTCTITNDDTTAHLKLVKLVTNDNGGKAVAADWTLTATGDKTYSGAAGFDLDVDAGTYALSESTIPGYTTTGFDCGASVTLALGESKTCTITNDDVAPKLTVIKVLLPNTDNGKFNLQIDGVTRAANVGNGGTTGAVAVNAGLHTVTETAVTGTNLADYITVIGGACDASGNITLALAENKTCTITNTKRGSLVVTKTVEWNGKPDTSKTFVICITGPSYPTEPNCQTIDYDGGTLTWPNLIPGVYTVTEDDPGIEWDVTLASSPVTVPGGGSGSVSITNSNLGKVFPAITIEKYVSPDGVKAWYEADTWKEALPVMAGTHIYFKFMVINSGNVGLGNIGLTDSRYSTSDCTVPSSLAVGESFECVIGPFQALEGQQVNTATATGVYKGITYSDTDLAYYIGYAFKNPAIAIAKTPDTQMVRSDDTVSFNIAVTNIGDIVLANVMVKDAQAPNCNKSIASLAAGASTSYACTLANVTADLTNSATVTAKPPVGPAVSATDTAFVDVIHPAVAVAKTPDTQMARSNDTVTFNITITNSGDVALANVTLTDIQAPDCNKSIASLAAGASTSYACALVNVTADLTNSAAVTAKPPVGPDVSATDTAFVDVIHPAIAIAKTPDTQMARSNDTVTFNITITNSGDVALANVTLTDIQAPDCNKSIASLAAGASTSYACALVNVTADLTNSATVTAKPPVGPDVSATDTAFVDVIHPAITIAKTPHSQIVHSGDTVTFNITITNSGDAALANMTVTDAQAPNCNTSIASLAVGASASYACTLANVTADLTNSATVTAKPPVGPDVSATDTAFVDVVNPVIAIEKYVSNDGKATWQDADTPAEALPVLAGTDVYFRLVVTNTGSAELTNIKLSDDPYSVSGCTVPSSLAIGGSFACMIGPFTALESQQVNTATVSGDYGGATYTETDLAHYIGDKPVVIANAEGTPVRLRISWSVQHPDGVTSYRYAVGTTPGGNEVVGWNEVPTTTTSITLTGLSLVPGQTYYAAVAARNTNSQWSNIGVSNPVTPAAGDQSKYHIYLPLIFHQ